MVVADSQAGGTGHEVQSQSPSPVGAMVAFGYCELLANALGCRSKN